MYFHFLIKIFNLIFVSANLVLAEEAYKCDKSCYLPILEKDQTIQRSGPSVF
jgi:hypothetical protein